jgi:hypothetical protein
VREYLSFTVARQAIEYSLHEVKMMVEYRASLQALVDRKKRPRSSEVYIFALRPVLIGLKDC